MIAIYTKYLGPTNTKGSRVKAYAHGDNRSVTIPYDYSGNYEMAHFPAVVAWVEKYLKYPPSIENMRYGNAPNGYVFCFDQSIVGK